MQTLRMMAAGSLIGRALIALVVAGGPCGQAQVRVNEIGASSSERLLTRNAEGIAHLGGGVQWWEGGFDDAGWSAGATPIGFGHGGLATDVGAQVAGITPTLYIRHEFEATAVEAGSAANLSLRVDFDSGFVAYLNGREVARANAGAPLAYVYADQAAYQPNAPNGTGTTYSLGAASSWLKSGTNVLAIEVHNDSVGSSNLLVAASLSVPGRPYVGFGDSCRWFPGRISPSGGVFDPALVTAERRLEVEWARSGFDDSAWSSGPGPLGYEGSSGYVLGTNLIGMRNNQTSLYMRARFTLTAAELAAISGLELDLDYDDGFIAFLNGKEIQRGNLGSPGEFVSHGSTADGDHGASNDGGGPFSPTTVVIDRSFLQVGENVLAGQVHNSSAGSSDLILHLRLRESGGATLVAPATSWRYFIGSSEPAPPPEIGNSSEPEFSDWVELHNPGTEAADLSGWRLSDDASEPGKFIFPDGTTIPAGGYLLVLADDREHLNGTTAYLHVGFKLSASGETVVLSDADGVFQSWIPGGFPAQVPTHSYGWDEALMNYGFMANPTPGAPNSGPVFSGRADAPDFDVEGGFHNGTVTLTLTSETPGATIRYTTDGTEPDEFNGMDYTGPIEVTAVNSKTGRMIRARSFKDGWIPSKSKSHTYLINQAAAIRTLPALLFSGDPEEVFYKPNGVMAIEGGFYSGDTWNPSGTSSYNIPLQRGIQYERPLLLEFYHPDGSPGFREDAGVRLSSSDYSRPRLRLQNTSASPWQSDPVEKPSFNLYLRDDYGKPALEYPWLGDDYPVARFEQLRIRAGKNDMVNPFIHDELVRRLYHDMGQESSLGITNTLYVNGSFKGYFNTTERLREPFMQAHHQSTGDWDVRQVYDFANGDSVAWDAMMTALNRDLTQLPNWEAALAYLDPVNMADYFLLNIYGATWDWPENNWVAARERSPEGRFRLYVWDAEGAFGLYNNKPVGFDTITNDLLGRGEDLSRLFQRLITSPEWRLIFADRIHKHLFNDGVLDDRAGSGSWIRSRAEELRAEYQPILSYVHGQTVNLSALTNWYLGGNNRRSYLFGPNRSSFANHDLWPALSPPTYNQHGGEVGSGFGLTMSAASGTVIYHTFDGSDPRLPGGEAAPGAVAYAGPVVLGSGRVVAKSRAYRASNRTWSALTEAEFEVDLGLPDRSSLVISEFMYHPADVSVSEMLAGFSDQDDFEFIELMNRSDVAIDLQDVAFTDGVMFRFGGSAITVLGPGERVLVVSNLAAFRQRYGSGLDSRIAGEYLNRLSNSGETLTLGLTGAAPSVLHSLTYLESSPWPECADGAGSSLVLVSSALEPDLANPGSWACSAGFGGELGGAGPDFDYARWVDFTFGPEDAGNSLVSGENRDPDGDGMDNFMEYASGGNPLVSDSPQKQPLLSFANVGEANHLVIGFSRSNWQLPVNHRAQVSVDLEDWTDLTPAEYEAASPTVGADGSIRESWRLLETVGSRPARYVRIVVD